MRKAIAFTILLALAIITPILSTSGHTSASFSAVATEFVSGSDALQQQTPSPVGAGGSMNAPYKRICKGETIPDGWVITALLADSTDCPGTEPNRVYIIKDISSFPVNSGQLICKNSPTPKGWRVIRRYSISKECPNVGSMVILRRR
jgi:hypothetical protein